MGTSSENDQPRNQEKKPVAILTLEEVGKIANNQEYAKVVERSCKKVIKDENLAKDAAQETWKVLSEYAEKGYEVRANLKGFLYRTAKNTAINVVKRYSNKFETPYTEEVQSHLDQVHSYVIERLPFNEKNALKVLFENIDDRQRSIIYLSMLGKIPVEVSHLLGISEACVSVEIKELKELLLIIIETLGNDDPPNGPRKGPGGKGTKKTRKDLSNKNYAKYAKVLAKALAKKQGSISDLIGIAQSLLRLPIFQECPYVYNDYNNNEVVGLLKGILRLPMFSFSGSKLISMDNCIFRSEYSDYCYSNCEYVINNYEEGIFNICKYTSEKHKIEDKKIDWSEKFGTVRADSTYRAINSETGLFPRPDIADLDVEAGRTVARIGINGKISLDLAGGNDIDHSPRQPRTRRGLSNIQGYLN